jgi:alkylhydroperoxidase family enzyme
VGAHARNLQLQGQDQKAVDEIGKGNLEAANLPEKEKALMEYVKVLTLDPGKLKDAQVQRLRTVGWTDDEIAEASFNTALFAFFNRMAEAYGLDYGDRAWYPPELREQRAAAPATKTPAKGEQPSK